MVPARLTAARPLKRSALSGVCFAGGNWTFPTRRRELNQLLYLKNAVYYNFWKSETGLSRTMSRVTSGEHKQVFQAERAAPCRPQRHQRFRMIVQRPEPPQASLTDELRVTALMETAGYFTSLYKLLFSGGTMWRCLLLVCSDNCSHVSMFLHVLGMCSTHSSSLMKSTGYINTEGLYLTNKPDINWWNPCSGTNRPAGPRLSWLPQSKHKM